MLKGVVRGRLVQLEMRIVLLLHNLKSSQLCQSVCSAYMFAIVCLASYTQTLTHLRGITLVTHGVFLFVYILWLCV